MAGPLALLAPGYLLLRAGWALSSVFHGAARFIVPYLVIKTLFALGISVVTITGSVWLSGYLESQILLYFDGITGTLSQILLKFGLLDGLTILMNCWIASITIKTIMTSQKKFRFFA